MKWLRVWLALFLLPVASPAAESVFWLLYDAPPLILRGDDALGDGFGIVQQEFLASHLSNFQHQKSTASLQRVWHDLGARDGVCSINLIRGKDQKYQFSDRPLPTPGFRLLIKSDQKGDYTAMLDENGAIDLEKLTGSAHLSGAYVTSRHYPEPIERFIARGATGGRLTGYAEPSQIFNLLQASRLDYAIVLAVELPYYLHHFPAMPAPVLLSIREVPLTNDGYIVCSRGPIGEKVIHDVNALLADDPNWAAYLKPLQRWFPPADFAAAMATRPR